MQFDIKYNTTCDTRPVTKIQICNPVTHKSGEYRALIDTGANYCAISSKIAEELGIEVAYTSTYNTASQTGVETDVCDIGVVIDGKIVNAVAGIMDTPDFEAVIGMNVIGITRFCIEPKSNKLKVTMKI